MNRVKKASLWLVGVAVVVLYSGTGLIRAQAPAPAPAAQTPAAPAKAPEAEEDPFAPHPAGPLPPGMTGSDTSDPRASLKPGMYDAGEAAMGLKHIAFLKKPDALQLTATSPDDPTVQKTIAMLGMRNASKMPKPMQMVIAQLAFANSDFAFQGTHLFQGNFYGIGIYDISDPAKTALLTTLICPGGQGDVSVYGNLLFMSVEMPNGRLDCGAQGFPPEPPPAASERQPPGHGENPAPRSPAQTASGAVRRAPARPPDHLPRPASAAARTGCCPGRGQLATADAAPPQARQTCANPPPPERPNDAARQATS